jgi:hypothetical protein
LVGLGIHQGSSCGQRENKNFNKRILVKAETPDFSKMPAFSNKDTPKSDIRKSDSIDRESNKSQKSTKRFKGQNRYLPNESIEDFELGYDYDCLPETSMRQLSSHQSTIDLKGCEYDLIEYQESSFHETSNATGNSMTTIKEESQENLSQSRPSNLSGIKRANSTNVSFSLPHYLEICL